MTNHSQGVLRMSFPGSELEQTIGKRPVRWEPAAGSGYGINTSRWQVELADSSSVFVKVALDELAADWLRKEHKVYATVVASYLPELRGWHDASVTFLAIEDLSDAHWPPPWPDHGVGAVLEALAAVHATDPPSGLPPLAEMRES